MIPDILLPHLDLLREEHVLVQAWKKTVAYIRYHNWYADTLALDRAAVNLPRFIAELAERLKAPEKWVSEPLRIVPAPKSQQWRVTGNGKRWEPVPARDKQKGTSKTGTKLRPLAHVSLRDQVAATAVMMCLADRVETLQGDPRDPVTDEETRKRVISYGNRLFCDRRNGELTHRWGSGKLYRAYYQDYRSFLSRPETVADGITATDGGRIVIVHSDLRQFYDRVRPELLAHKLNTLARSGDDPSFLTLAERLLNWTWNERDASEVVRYAEQTGIPDFAHVALPQGLVASGFFANVALLDFDQALRESISHEIEPGVHLHDVCRYVDDLRIVATVADRNRNLGDIEGIVTNWLQRFLEASSFGLEASREKTKAATFREDERPLVQQSRRMRRIQSAISGGFDAGGGEEILDAVLGLMRSQERYSEQRTEGQGWPFMPIADVRDATVARFAAGRFRYTYRSLRPLLSDGEQAKGAQGKDEGDDTQGRPRVPRTQADLDDEAKAFALGLIENWVQDPSNVRLLRIGLDLWPADSVLKSVLDLLRPFTGKGGLRGEPRRVAWYCLAEIFRAGATETGFVENEETLPTGIDINAYHALLQQEAARLAALPAAMLPWYLRQQVLLFLAASDPSKAPIFRKGRSTETGHYRELIRYLNGEDDGLTGAAFATVAILARRSFRSPEVALQLASRRINPSGLDEIAEKDPAFALELLESTTDLFERLLPRRRDDLCLKPDAGGADRESLATVVLAGGPDGAVRNELSILQFAQKFLEQWLPINGVEAITPSNVLITVENTSGTIAEVREVGVAQSRVAAAGSMYLPPEWCPPEERWRFQLGYLLRFILCGRQDFTQIVRPPHWKEEKATYRAAVSHWYQRLYGLYSGQAAFGDDWLPISDWTEQLLFDLLRWPGCGGSKTGGATMKIDATLALIEQRIKELKEKRGESGLLLLPLKAQRLIKTSGSRPLRACVMQTVIPDDDDYRRAMEAGDLTLSGREIRRRHRGHLSAALAAIDRMLDLRETHLRRDGRLDWLILPELSVHPHDVSTHLVPFARAHRTVILAGLSYQSPFPGRPLGNSALWVIPTWSSAHGLQVFTRRQGKQHLAPDENPFHENGEIIRGYRPCQWLVGYEWSAQATDRPLWLTSSVCYDATDLNLAADLRGHSDVFAIPALNKDVRTFDQMALALHYHMFQMVVVVNNGRYGGSNAYAPFKEQYKSQVFHLHGQPQATVAFLEIDDIGVFISRVDEARRRAAPETTPSSPVTTWKYPPAGL